MSSKENKSTRVVNASKISAIAEHLAKTLNELGFRYKWIKLLNLFFC